MSGNLGGLKKLPRLENFKTKAGHTGLIVIIDPLTKYANIVPWKSKEYATVTGGFYIPIRREDSKKSTALKNTYIGNVEEWVTVTKQMIKASKMSMEESYKVRLVNN